MPGLVLLVLAVAAPVERVTFDEAVRRATARNPNLEVAIREIDRAHGIMREVRAAALPTLYGNAIATRIDSARTTSTLTLNGAGTPVATTATVQPRDSAQGNLQLTLPLVVPQRWVQWSHAAENVDIARLSLEDVRRLIATTAARAYVTVLGQHRLVEANRIARDNAKDHLTFAKARLDAGMGNRLDVVRSAQDVAADESLLSNALVNLVRSQEALGVLVAGDAPVDTAEDPQFGVLPAESDAMREVEERRSDVRAARGRLTAAQHVVRDSYADYLPLLQAVVTPFAQTYSSLTTPTTGWQAQLVLTVPFFDGGFRYGAHEERSAIAAESAALLDATLRQARADVRTAFEEVRRTDEALGSAREAARLAREALDMTSLAYRAGATNDLDVTDAQRRFRDAETVAAVAEDAARQARIDLLSGAGRFP
jgi:outer membrane protein